VIEGIKPKLTDANVMVTLMAFVVLGGGAYAGVAQIGAGDIKPNAVRSKHIKNGEVKIGDLTQEGVPLDVEIYWGKAGPSSENKSVVVPCRGDRAAADRWRSARSVWWAHHRVRRPEEQRTGDPRFLPTESSDGASRRNSVRLVRGGDRGERGDHRELESRRLCDLRPGRQRADSADAYVICARAVKGPTPAVVPPERGTDHRAGVEWARGNEPMAGSTAGAASACRQTCIAA
jgi:hypothetical protein